METLPEIEVISIKVPSRKIVDWTVEELPMVYNGIDIGDIACDRSTGKLYTYQGMNEVLCWTTKMIIGSDILIFCRRASPDEIVKWRKGGRR